MAIGVQSICPVGMSRSRPDIHSDPRCRAREGQSGDTTATQPCSFVDILTHSRAGIALCTKMPAAASQVHALLSGAVGKDGGGQAGCRQVEFEDF